MTSKKFLMLDTNVLIYDPKALSNFKNCEVIIPLVVIEELDDLKKLPNELGRNARSVMRSFDEMAKKGMVSRDFETGMTLINGTIVHIFSRYEGGSQEKFTIDKTSRKNQVLIAAKYASKNFPNMMLLSKDFATRLKAQMIGINAQDYKNASVSLDQVHRGVHEIDVTKSVCDQFLKNGVLDWHQGQIYTNEYCILNSKEGTQLVGRYDSEQKKIIALTPLPGDLWGVHPRNIQQRCALDLLLRDDVKLITLVGQAGTGKTLLALAAGLKKVFDESCYSKILVSRPIMPLGKDIGYLPGSKDEKLFHWMQPIYDNLEYLCQSNGNDEDTQENLRWIKESRKLEMEAVTYIRGRTLPNMFIIIDEAQNLTPHEVKTVISRAGEGTKVILTGDPSQIDNPYLDVDTNGLTFTISKFKNHKIYGNINFEVTERSELSSLAARVL